MSSKTVTLFICTKCDAQSTKWSGRCLECNGWGTVVESVAVRLQGHALLHAEHLLAERERLLDLLAVAGLPDVH